MKRLIQSAIFILVLFSLVNAQEYYAKHYSVYDGLPSPEIYDFAQDSLGRMLFVTRGGFIVTYDGFQWRKSTLHLKDSDLHGMISAVYVDEKGIIWGTDFKTFNGIYYYKNNEWKLLPSPNSLMLASKKPVTIKVIYKNNQPVVLLLFSNKNLLIWKNKKFYYLKKDHIPAKHIRTILAAKSSFYILDHSGLFKLKNTKLERIPLPPALKKEKFYSFCKGPSPINQIDSADFYFLSQNYFIHWKQNRIKKIPLDFHPDKFAKHFRYQMIPDGFGGIFIGSRLILKHFNAYLQKWEDIQLSRDYKHIGITNILRDRENDYWIATSRGIFKIPSLRFLNFTSDQSLLNEITSIREFSPGHYFLASTNRFAIYNGHHFKSFSLTPKPNIFMRILTSTKDPNSDNIIAVAQNLGIIKIKPHGKFSVMPSPGTQFFNCIIPDLSAKHGYLIGASNGLWRLFNSQLTYLNLPVLHNKYIRRIYRDSHNTIYLGTVHNGIYKIPNGAMDSILQIRNASSCANNIYAITELESGRILVGTYGGLYEVHSDSLIKSPLFTKKIPIFSILTDQQKNIWLGTDQGVYIVHSHKITHFDVRHGLSGMECNRDALYMDSKGHIWIGTNTGLSLYQPLYDQPAPSPIVRILNQPPSNKSFSFNSPFDDWTVKFLCISFKDERNITLRYLMKGLEKWHVLPKLRLPQLSYWKLEPGTYQFQVQAQNVEGKWSPIVSSKSFKIPSHLWKNWYFILFTMALIIILIYFLIHIYYKDRLNKQLEEEIKERTSALKISEEKYRQLFLNSLDGIFITTPSGKFLDVNPAGVEFFGYDSKQDLLAVDIPKDLYVDPKDRERFKNEMTTKGHVHNFEIDFKRRDGRIVTAVLSSTCGYDEQGHIISYSGYLRDITEWKEMKQRLAHSQRMESLGLLAGGIAHDFNNILAGILGYASLMKMRMKVDDKFFRYIEIIEQSAQRAAELTNQLLIFSRRGQTKLRAINMAAAIDEALKIIQSTFPKSIEIIVDVEKDLPQILADPTQMQQIIINLAVNARDALPDGEGSITISACKFLLQNTHILNKPEAKPGEYVCLKISDTGIGIPDEIKEKIFEPFFSTKPKGKGTGMGLAMVYGAIRNLGGFIQLKSEVNKGTIFSLYFPVRAIQVDESVDAQDTIVLEGNEKILVVDDEEMVRNFCKLALEKYGYHVFLAENGKQALEILGQLHHQFDLVVLDMIMPVLDGVKTYKKIRQTNQTLRFLISSGYSDSDKLEMLKKDPLVEVIYKPYKAKKLVQNVRQILNTAKRKKE